ncbi:uncharacterized protein SAPINGB_P003568 [Magnusiomyces paraingens]|uniref:Alkyl transferase n=1 Tax=Magnusiomyces paraingens TaxID=2606893 RepID=A0A5E8BVE5_9ASCO|nr:uncharacterized protein SAPINGB_P003568 [Saprochaete ingens]VVT53427.1 unnamed protein product [Saprochaete ingens]
MSLRSWISSFPLMGLVTGFSQDILTSILKTGPIPEHIAFIMDGNRRFAKKNGLELGEGHVAGFESLGTILEVLYSAGVNTITVYAFSIENFNRPKHEIDSLFNIIRSKLVLIKDKDQVPSRYGIKVKFIGNRDLIPEDIMVLIEELEEATKDMTRGILNIAFPYTSRDDIAAAIRNIATSVEKGQIEAKDIDIVKFEKAMYTGQSPDLDIMVRTSGETRFSDFMIWQGCDNCTLEFIDTLWPDINAWNMFKILFKWSYKSTKYFEKEEIKQSKRADVIKSLSGSRKLNLPKQYMADAFNPTSLPTKVFKGGPAAASTPTGSSKSKVPPKVSVTEVARNDVLLANA